MKPSATPPVAADDNGAGLRTSPELLHDARLAENARRRLVPEKQIERHRKRANPVSFLMYDIEVSIWVHTETEYIAFR